MFLPLLASPPNDKYPIKYPVLASPKLDGVRAIVRTGTVMSRALLPFPNNHTQNMFGKPEYEYFDGELIVGKSNDPKAYNNTAGAINKVDGTPDVSFYVFDIVPSSDVPFKERYRVLSERVKNLDNVHLVEHKLINNEQELFEYEQLMLDQGYEGIMIRDPNGPYKYGRSTAKEQILLKYKRFIDSEAVITGFVPLYKNNNEATKNALGRTKRSSSKANKVQQEKLGALVVYDVVTKISFEIGTGFTDKQRKEIWRDRDSYWIGKTVKYKSQPHGVVLKPRCPVFLGERYSNDIT